MSELEEIAEQIAAKTLPPVETWRPSHQGEIDIKIDANGNWFHEGAPFTRLALVKLFASILSFDGQRYSLVTPVERWYIEVADVPFVITQAQLLEDTWVTTTNLGDQTIVSPAHPIRLESYQDVWIPYQTIRANLLARVSRAVYTQWAEHAIAALEAQSTDLDVGAELCLRSGDYAFAVAR